MTPHNDADESANRLRIAELVAHSTTLGALVLTQILYAYTLELNPVAIWILETVGFAGAAGIALGTVGLLFELYERLSCSYPRIASAGAWSIAVLGVADVGVNLWLLSVVGFPDSIWWQQVGSILLAGALGAGAAFLIRRHLSAISSRLPTLRAPSSPMSAAFSVFMALLVVVALVVPVFGMSAVGVSSAATSSLTGDFEDQTLEDWSDDAGSTAVVAEGYSGSYSMETGSAIISGTPADPNDFRFEGYVRKDGTNNFGSIKLSDPSTSKYVDFQFDKSNGGTRILSYDGSAQSGTGYSGAFEPNTWYRMVAEADGDTYTFTLYDPATGDIVNQKSLTHTNGGWGANVQAGSGNMLDMDNYDISSTTSTVSGYVEDTGGNALGSADVKVTQSGSLVKSTTTASDGSYSVEITDGDYTVEASKSGYLAENQTISVAGSAVTGVNFSLTQYGVDGTVSAPDGSAVGGTDVVAEQNGSAVASTTTASDGTYSLDLSAGSYEIVVKSSDYGTRSKTVDVNGRESLNFSYGREVPFDLWDETEDQLYSDNPKLIVEGSVGIQTARFNHNTIAYVGVQNGRTYDLTVVSDTPAVYDFKGYRVQDTLVKGILRIPALDENETTATATPENGSLSLEGLSMELRALRGELNATSLSLQSQEPVEQLDYTIYNGNGDPAYNGSRDFSEPTQYYEGRIADALTENASQYDNATLDYSGTFENGSTFSGTEALSGSFGSSGGGAFGPTGSSGGGPGSPLVGIGLIGAAGYLGYRTLGGSNGISQRVQQLTARFR